MDDSQGGHQLRRLRCTGGLTYLHESVPQTGPLLHQLAMLLQEGAEEQAQVLDEVLLIVLAVGVGQPDVGV